LNWQPVFNTRHHAGNNDPQDVIPATAKYNFGEEQQQLIAILNAAGNTTSGDDFGPHPLLKVQIL
jgi:hypothetical protein